MAILLLSDTIAWGFKGNTGTFGYWAIRLSNFVVFFTSDLIPVMFNVYLCNLLFPEGNNGHSITFMESLTGKNGIPKRIAVVYWISMLSMLLVIISQFTGIYYTIDENNIYHRGAFHPISMILPLICSVIEFTIIIQYRRSMKNGMFRALIVYMLFPVAGSIVLLFYYCISFVNIDIAISAMYMFYTAIGNQDKELADMRISVMMSQIKPHFIYNTITAIQGVCMESPEQAIELMGDFAKYLRGNLNSITQKECIPFDDELEHTKKYLAIEKKRFGNRINVVYDIKERDFRLPALTLQPIVENAVKHGITPKKEGGTIQIQTYRDHNKFVVRIEDNGIGFGKIPDNSKRIGIKNVKSRLRDMCDGSLNISGSDEGTVAEIYLPDVNTNYKRK